MPLSTRSSSNWPLKTRPLRALKVRLHAVGINEHRLNQIRGLIQKIIGQRSGVRNNDALGRRVRDIPFMPEGNIFKSSLRVRTDNARQSGDLLAGDRISLVRHGRRAFLFLAEKFLGLTDFGALQMANLSCDFVERRRDRSQRREIKRVPVALNHLRRNGRSFQPQARAHLLFEVQA